VGLSTLLQLLQLQLHESLSNSNSSTSTHSFNSTYCKLQLRTLRIPGSNARYSPRHSSQLTCLSLTKYSDSSYFNLRPVAAAGAPLNQLNRQCILYFSVVIELLLLKHSGSIRCEFVVNSVWIRYEFGVNFSTKSIWDRIIHEFSPNRAE
jgi:hypothetical protein